MSGARENILDPLERSSEIIFGLIMALTFTSTISLLASKADVRMMLGARSDAISPGASSMHRCTCWVRPSRVNDCAAWHWRSPQRPRTTHVV